MKKVLLSLALLLCVGSSFGQTAEKLIIIVIGIVALRGQFVRTDRRETDGEIQGVPGCRV